MCTPATAYRTTILSPVTANICFKSRLIPAIIRLPPHKIAIKKVNAGKLAIRNDNKDVRRVYFIKTDMFHLLFRSRNISTPDSSFCQLLPSGELSIVIRNLSFTLASTDNRLTPTRCPRR